ncbi:Clr6 histone deacetylase associated PHD protein-2 Cph2 [Fusarium falciforme]|uniref:Clr6 histone deacetylase associated PHD protein-2 Cph2 n=1 Tax=Fusarium falciforme TaxID=195108 RepID=A0A9W8REW0_9HYPO|nr:Clr6 histone deacetylase associated PHD protein-2 Cph2 [Fusarium falciforme]KAJ4205543.1 Clr6 histone deacetylase associated PHD protein-2 Cph2 [Fusarium falciforme]KAJ4247364.1 Clr6 histone deacetylase associated PHD protein-2 Cph2 [Fusarium falciforme]
MPSSHFSDMADHDSSNSLFGLQDPNLGFVDDGSVVKSDPSSSSLPNDSSSSRPQTQQQYYDAAAWQFNGTPPYDSYDPSSTAPPTQTSYQSSPWALAFGQDQQQNLQQLPVSAGLDSLAATTLSPESIYAASIPSNPPLGPGNLQDPAILQPHIISHLTPALQEKLRNIAMPPHLQYNSPKSASSPDSAVGEGKTGVLSSPDPAEMSSKASRKRKSSADPDEEEEDDDGNQPVKKTAHNMIEKRYRTNLNDKIAALRDSVPSLRIMSKSARGEDTTEDREELHGLTPAHKLNKATVLSKATEYIRHLEKRNTRLLDENGAMQARIAAFEKLFMAGAMNGAISPLQQPPTPIQYAQDSQQFVGSPMSATQEGGAPPAGMIQVPDDMKRIISAQMAAGQPYPVPQQPYRGGNPALIRQQQIQQQQQMQQNRWSNAGPYFGKLMVGSLAGLMILEAVREDEVSNEKPEGRGLFAVPLHLLRAVASGLDINVMGYHIHTSLRIILLLGTFLWVFLPSLFATVQQKPKKPQVGVLQAAPSLASPIHVRRQAWLTAIQTVWVPRHNFFLEATALILKTLKLSLRNAIGIHGYQMLTGLTEEQETARVKAWSIALDSQLAGGDVEINKSRLVLTLLASGTLPDSPMRLMLKALHIRLLLWDPSQNRLHLGVSNAIAAKLARTKWNEARQLNRLITQLRRGSSEQHDDDLPEHLAALVEQECDEVLNEDIIQRAHNLAFNTETTYNITAPMDGMDSVVDDTAVGSPLDAVAAWWSTQTLHRVMLATMEKDEEALLTKTDDIELAINTAPIGSTAQARAIVARAVLIDKARGANIASALQSMGNEKVDALLSTSICIIDSSFQASTPDLRLALRCAMAIAHLRRVECTPGTTHQGLRIIESIMTRGNASQMSLLGCTAALQLMEELFEHKVAAEMFQSSLERLSGGLRLWMGGAPGEKCGVTSDVREKVVDRCLTITKSVVGMDSDTGYGSLDECEDDGC